MASAGIRYRLIGTAAHRAPGHRVLIACAPKTGSTYLMTLLAMLPGFSRVILNVAGGRQEEELRQDRLLAFHHLDYVAKNHIVCSDHRAALIARYGLKTIVLTRSLADSIVSFRDHVVSAAGDLPLFEPPDNFATLAKPEQYDALIDLAAPWYINFAASWLNRADEVGPVFLRYETLVKRPVETMRDIADSFGIEADEATIAAAVANASRFNTRLNVGITGRGLSELSPAQMGRLNRLLDLHGEKLRALFDDCTPAR